MADTFETAAHEILVVREVKENRISISLLLWNTCLRWILRRDKSWSDHRKARR